MMGRFARRLVRCWFGRHRETVTSTGTALFWSCPDCHRTLRAIGWVTPAHVIAPHHNED